MIATVQQCAPCLRTLRRRGGPLAPFTSGQADGGFLLTGAGHSVLPVNGDMRNFTFMCARTRMAMSAGRTGYLRVELARSAQRPGATALINVECGGAGSLPACCKCRQPVVVGLFTLAHVAALGTSPLARGEQPSGVTERLLSLSVPPALRFWL